MSTQHELFWEINFINNTTYSCINLAIFNYGKGVVYKWYRIAVGTKRIMNLSIFDVKKIWNENLVLIDKWLNFATPKRSPYKMGIHFNVLWKLYNIWFLKGGHFFEIPVEIEIQLEGEHQYAFNLVIIYFTSLINRPNFSIVL